MDKPKKRWYKRWWAILLFIFLILGFIGSLLEDESSETTKVSELASDKNSETTYEYTEKGAKQKKILVDEFKWQGYRIKQVGVGEDKIAYSKSGDIYAYDIPSKEIKRITYDSSSQTLPYITKNTVFWLDNRGRVSPVYMYNFEEKKEKPLETGVGGRIVVGAQGDNLILSGTHIFNLKSNTNTELPQPKKPFTLDYVDIYDDIIVGILPIHPNTDVFYYDLKDDELKILNLSYIQKEPKVYENKIVWSDNRNGERNYDIYMYDISTGEETQITSQQDTNEINPEIYGDYVVYKKIINSDTYIHLYNIKTKEDKEISDKVWPSVYRIYDNKIVWATCDTEYCRKEQIYLYII